MYKNFQLKRDVDKSALKRHFKSLSDDDRYLRFGYIIQDESIDDYVESTYRKSNNIWFGIEKNSKLIATSHVVLDSIQSLSEFGLTVNEKFRNKGIAKLLFQISLDLCRKHKIQKIVLIYLAQNAAMSHITNYFEMSSDRSDSDIISRMFLSYD